MLTTPIWFLISEADQEALRPLLSRRWQPPHDPVLNPFIPETEPDPEYVREMQKRPHPGVPHAH